MSDSEIVVKKKGQTTIPAKIRKKFRIEEGTRLQVVETDVPSIVDWNAPASTIALPYVRTADTVWKSQSPKRLQELSL